MMPAKSNQAGGGSQETELLGHAPHLVALGSDCHPVVTALAGLKGDLLDVDPLATRVLAEANARDSPATGVSICSQVARQCFPSCSCSAVMRQD